MMTVSLDQVTQKRRDSVNPNTLSSAKRRKGETGLTSFRCDSPKKVTCRCLKCNPVTRWLWRKNRNIHIEDVAWRIGFSQGQEYWLSIERPFILVGPARSGKGVNIVVNAILEAPGSVITTSTRDDNMRLTALCRAKRGPVWVFNLDGVGDRPHSIRWSPLEGCEDPQIAAKRAATLVASSGLGGDNQVWATSATKVVQALLHAAALKGLGIGVLYDWSISPTRTKEAIDILKEYKQAEVHLDEWYLELEHLEREDARLKGNKWFGVGNAFAGISQYKVRQLLDYKPTDKGYFNADEFLDSYGTIYMIASGADTTGQTAGSTGLLYSLFIDHMTDAAHKRAARMNGRLDPPTSYIFDELANIYPWQRAAFESARGSGEGIQLMAIFQTLAQLKEAYGGMANILIDNSTLGLLGGCKDPEFLTMIANLFGKMERVETTVSADKTTMFGKNVSTSKREVEGATVDELRRIPFGTTVLVEGTMRPAIVTLTPYAGGYHARCIQESDKWHRQHSGQVVTSEIRARN
jgi:type IV secretion system protein VirD4